jgi:uncharacterized membrane protein YhaH (DUF805 family)
LLDYPSVNDQGGNMSDFNAAAGAVPAGPAGASYNPRLISLSGRIGRLRYWIYGAALSVAMIPVVILALGASLVSHTAPGPLSLLLVFAGEAAVLFGCVVLVRRRLNDLDKSGWLTLLMLVPFVNAVFGLWILFWPGTSGVNRFGPPPSANSRAIVGAAWVLGVLSVGTLVALCFMPAVLGAGALAAAASASF